MVEATQAYPDDVLLPEVGIEATQRYPDGTEAASGREAAAEAEDEAAAPAEGEGEAAARAEGEAPKADEPPKKKRGKPKDDMAPPRPKNPYQRVTGDARARIKEEKPELVTDLKGMAMALKEEWDKVSQEEKDRMQKEYEEEMAIWKPKWAAYKETPHYKQFFEIKQDWVDKRQLKKLVKKLNKDAPKRPKSGYMLYAAEIRERVQKEVAEAGGGMGDIGKKISECWNALDDAKKQEYADQSAEMKKVYDVEIVEYKKSEAWGNFCDQKAKMESKQVQKKLIRTKLDEAPKKSPSSFALFRSEVMPKVLEENKGLPTGEIAKKIGALWVEAPQSKKDEYQAKASELREEYEKNLLQFKKKQQYTDYLLERQAAKARENKLLNLRETPKRPKTAFSMYADEHKSEVPPGKGEGKGRSALLQKFMEAPEAEKDTLLAKERELKVKWVEDMQAFKEGKKYLGFKALEKKIKMEYMNEATKVVTLRFLADAPKPPPKTPFGMFVTTKRKAMAEEGSAPPLKSRKEKLEELNRLKEEWAKADLQTKHSCDVERKELQEKWKEDCKAFMQNEQWQDYLAECRKLRVPVQSLLKEKKKILRKLKNGMDILPLPSKPETMPTKPPAAIKLFLADKLSEIKDTKMLPEMWQKLDPDERKKYTEQADEKMKAYRDEVKEFMASDEGKTYFREVKRISRRNRIAKAKDTFLQEMPKKPVAALNIFMKKNSKVVRIQNPGVKGADVKKLLMDKWANMDHEQKDQILEEEQKNMAEYTQKMEEFRKSENWLKFKRALQVKAKAKAKGANSIPKPKRPTEAPQKPLDAFKQYCKDNAGGGKSLEDLSKAFNELSEEDKADRRREAQERLEAYMRETADFDKTPVGRKYARAVANYVRKKRLALARAKFMKDEPKRPLTAFQLFAAEKRGDISRDFPDVKGIGPVQQKLNELWKDLDEEGRAEWLQKETAAKEDYDKALEEFHKSANYKKFQAIINRLNRKPGGKAKAKSSRLALPPPPANLPKKPPTGFFLYMSEERSKGTAGNNAKLTEGWRELGAEGQKRFMDEAASRQTQYEKDMKEFTKSVDGKKYLRLKAAAEKKNRMHQAKTRFLGGESAPKEPKRPPSAYFLFVQETRSTLPPGKLGEVAKQLTDMWNKLTPEDKKVYEDKTDALKQQYEKDMAEYKSSAGFKKYDKAIKNIKRLGKPKPKAKTAAGRGGGKGGGRGRGSAAAERKPAASDSDSDVMGSDEDNSSSSDSDSD